MLYLKYNVSGHMDGGGAQVHRKLAIYSLAVQNGLKYIEAPLIGVITPSFSPNVESRPQVIAAWNMLTDFLPALQPEKSIKREFFDPWLSSDFFKIALEFNQSNVDRRFLFKHFFDTHFLPSLRQFRRLNFLKSISHIFRALDKIAFLYWLYSKKNCVLIITEPFRVVQSGNDYIRNSKTLKDLRGVDRRIEIGVHVRRGDLKATDSSRYLADEYYTKVVTKTIQFLTAQGNDYFIVYYVDFPKRGKFLGVENEYFSWNFANTDEMYSVNIQNDAHALMSLSLSDVIIGSKSSYSFVAGLLSKALVIQPKWWIKNPVDWITIDFDQFNVPLTENWVEEK